MARTFTTIFFEVRKQIVKSGQIIFKGQQIPEAKAFKNFQPLLNRVLVQRLAAGTKIKSQVLQATVVAVGPGAINKTGAIMPIGVKVGEKVLLPKKRGTKVVLEDQDYFLFWDGVILGKFIE
ncbi:10 kDa heat shock protein, mitochondrial-like [Tachysurus fulvidraco]|uniref:10 kDa heat shock protein, mitochondrial-like n=1 Tax=Tachysurus fulvidraco TaxID=1234273 RepID=UPI001FEF1770|nr:10 kDa heat shock protein, mitochondrial-like [Tachysurus fulvidraco]XP_047671115.1 10 kDa heat shock protein, mitochondrial-like [Tachysurus fulvidraco]XP_047671116.1 10 kDa heat shock protein, mitochondrial-like [Tachysurus fulvidraco]